MQCSQAQHLLKQLLLTLPFSTGTLLILYGRSSRFFFTYGEVLYLLMKLKLVLMVLAHSAWFFLIEKLIFSCLKDQINIVIFLTLAPQRGWAVLCASVLLCAKHRREDKVIHVVALCVWIRKAEKRIDEVEVHWALPRRTSTSSTHFASCACSNNMLGQCGINYKCFLWYLICLKFLEMHL
jgi:hypothetical protein